MYTRTQRGFGLHSMLSIRVSYFVRPHCVVHTVPGARHCSNQQCRILMLTAHVALIAAGRHSEPRKVKRLDMSTHMMNPYPRPLSS